MNAGAESYSGDSVTRRICPAPHPETGRTRPNPARGRIVWRARRAARPAPKDTALLSECRTLARISARVSMASAITPSAWHNTSSAFVVTVGQKVVTPSRERQRRSLPRDRRSTWRR